MITGDGKMRIAQVAPLTEAVPPKLYGGTERVVHWLTEELVSLGHDVTLFQRNLTRHGQKRFVSTARFAIPTRCTW
jgi:hypothetical protein